MLRWLRSIEIRNVLDLENSHLPTPGAFLRVAVSHGLKLA
jgi:hypothetical protein